MANRPAYTNVAATLYRDYNTIGVPLSGVYNPTKASLRTYFAENEGFINDLYDKAASDLTAVGGTGDVATAVATPTVDALAAGQSYWYTPTAANTVSGPTLNISGLGASTLADSDGVSLPPGAVVIGRRYLLVYDGTKLRVLSSRDPILFKTLDADDTGGQNVNTVQPWFPTLPGLTLPIGAWQFDGLLWLSRAAGTISHTTSLQFGGSATYSIVYDALINTGDAAALATPAKVSSATAAATNIKAASTSATEQIIARVMGYLKVTVAGTFIPQYIYSVAPGGTPTTKQGTTIRFWPRMGGIASHGAWA